MPSRHPFNASKHALRVRKVCVILTSSRSGSSLVTKALSSHPDITSLGGEIDPFLKLSRNGFPYTSDSDSITTLLNKEELLEAVCSALTVPSDELADFQTIRQRWYERFLIQFPKSFSEQSQRDNLLMRIDTAIREITSMNLKEEHGINRLILNEVFKNEPWRINYYDGYKDDSMPERYFNEVTIIEEPPFVTPSLYARQLKEQDFENKTFLFKATADAHRIGMYEELFPNAEIQYLHLTRGYAETVNGLMDGWLSPTGFFSHDMGAVGAELRIQGYSDVIPFGKRWWKFDLPPNWREFSGATLVEVCLNQWLSAHKAIRDSHVPRTRISFEQFLSDPTRSMKIITDFLHLDELRTARELPVVMATEVPKPERWRKREREILYLGEREDVREMMQVLGYEMPREREKIWPSYV